MNIGGVLMLAFIGSLAQSAAAQAAFAVGYSQLFSLITWTSIGLMGAAASVAGQNLGAGKPDRADAAVHVAAHIAMVGAAFIGAVFFFFPGQLLAVFGMNEPVVVEIGTQLLRVLSVSGLFIAVALTYTGGLQGTGDTKSPLYISIISQIVVPLGICFVIQQIGTLQPIHIWIAILVGHATRCALSVLRSVRDAGAAFRRPFARLIWQTLTSWCSPTRAALLDMQPDTEARETLSRLSDPRRSYHIERELGAGDGHRLLAQDLRRPSRRHKVLRPTRAIIGAAASWPRFAPPPPPAPAHSPTYDSGEADSFLYTSCRISPVSLCAIGSDERTVGRRRDRDRQSDRLGARLRASPRRDSPGHQARKRAVS